MQQNTFVANCSQTAAHSYMVTVPHASSREILFASLDTFLLRCII